MVMVVLSVGDGCVGDDLTRLLVGVVVGVVAMVVLVVVWCYLFFSIDGDGNCTDRTGGGDVGGDDDGISGGGVDGGDVMR